MGNLAGGMVTEEAMRQLFSSTMQAAFPEQQAPGLDPVASVSMHSEGRYAFVELRTPEMATAALALDGQVQLMGTAISVGRPSGYVDPSKAQQAAEAAAQALKAFEARAPRRWRFAGCAPCRAPRSFLADPACRALAGYAGMPVHRLPLAAPCLEGTAG